MANRRIRYMGDINGLPEGCLANVLSFTGPKDACRLSVVSPTFRSAAESDTVWERFLPPDYQSLISQSSDPYLLTRLPSKKQLCVSLCQNPILIGAGRKSFSLDKWSGKKCYMLSARDLSIIWVDTPAYWRWTAEPESRFAEVAVLTFVCWLEIRGKINTSMLSPWTLYTACLVFKITDWANGFYHQPINVGVGLVGSESSYQEVYLLQEGGHAQGQHFAEMDGQYPKQRGDGWLEVELGEFFNKESEDGELEFSVLEVKRLFGKSGLVVQGIELRPKEAN